LDLKFKIATDKSEFDQIHRLNYRTFVEEIPQHDSNDQGFLVDKFHDENTYLIGKDEDMLVGMMAVRSNRPFSLDQKVDQIEKYLPPHKSICEFRLLAIHPDYRNIRVIQGLLKLLARYCSEQKYDLGVASCHVKQKRLYKHIGLLPFADPVGEGDAKFQPMYMTLTAYKNLREETVIFE